MNTEMNNPLNHIDELLVRFLSQEANMQEQQVVKQWLAEDVKNQKYLEELSMLWETSTSLEDFNAHWLKEDWIKVQKGIDELKLQESAQSAKMRTLVYTFSKIAAAVILCIGVYFFAERWLADGSVKETISLAEVKMLTLPDGSKVFLKGKAKLKYPETFGNGKREVSLEGEAFFEITKDLQKPFLIKNGETTTEVLGTSFNVNANDTSVIVTVVTGKVKLYQTKNYAIVMTAGNQGIYSDHHLEKKVNDDLNFLSWKTNILTFKNAPLQKVIDDLNRHYGKQIKLTEAFAMCRLTSTYENQTLEEILQELALVFSIKIEKTENQITIKGKGC
jgi:transmembrane sensor